MATTVTNIAQDKNDTQAFTVNDQRMTVFANVTVWDDTATGIISSFDQSHLINRGTVFGNYGVSFASTADFARVVNTRTGVIWGEAGGVYLNGDHSTIVNQGIIGGEQQAVGFASWVRGTLVNSGKLFSFDDAVEMVTGNAAVFTITNAGVIHGIANAMHYSSGPPGKLTITNAASGLIKGVNALLVDGNGTVSITNHGRMVGSILDGNMQKMTIRNDGSIAGEVHLGSGSDSYNGAGGRSGRIYGESGEDRITGGSRADWMDGGFGRDILKGGGAGDRFHFIQSADTIPGGFRDVIVDFNHGQHDRLDISDLAATPFAFRGTQPLLGGGLPSVRYTIQNPAGTANDKTIVHGDINGDTITDFQVELRGIHHLVAGDFVL